QGINRFIQLTDESDKVPNLKGKLYMDFRLSAPEWTKLKLMHEVLQEPADTQQSFSWYGKTDDTDAYFICLGMHHIYFNMFD
ncbi:hypothetical protein BDR05DRAFT_890603, partial [Suillus weaverae]